VCKHLFLLDGIVEDDEAESAEATGDDTTAEETPQFSLHAIAGVAFSDTMQIRVALGDATLTALLDSGSTHNFISEDAALRFGLLIQHRPRLTATVANGERVACVGVLRHAPLAIHGDTFYVDLFVMPLAGYDVVLGTQWLATLGPIVWYFSARTMSFRRHARAVCWHALVGSAALALSATASSTSLLEELLDTFSDVFAEPHGLPPPRNRDHSITLVPGA